MLGGYAVLLCAMTRLSRRLSSPPNAEFEDHSEHYYAELVAAHPEVEEQPVAGGLAQEYGSFGPRADQVPGASGSTSAYHMNASFLFADKPELVALGTRACPRTRAPEASAAEAVTPQRYAVTAWFADETGG